MVLITFGLWLFLIPFYPVRCINCGLTRSSAHWENASRGGKIFIVCVWVCIVIFVVHTMREGASPQPTAEQASTAETQTSALPTQPIEQPANSSQPVVAPLSPPEASQPMVPEPTAPVVLPDPAPVAQMTPSEVDKPNPGVLCDGVIAVPQNGELTFTNLPGDRLRFTFDHDAWSPSIRRQPDGTQTLTMRSIKPGIQTKCDIRWEIAQ